MKRKLFTLLALFLFAATAAVAQDQMEVKDADGNLLMQVNDEGEAGSITLPGLGDAPSVFTDKIYSIGGSLYWNGVQLLTNGSLTGWSLTGNAGTVPGTNFLGTTDNAPLEFKVNSKTAFRLYPHDLSPNIIGGFAENAVATDVFGATISGGGAPGLQAEDRHYVSGDFGTISGGWNNIAGAGASIGGGGPNVAEGLFAAIPGGSNNTAAGDYSFAAGRRAIINAAHDGAFLFSDQNNFDFNSAATNEFAARATGGVRFVTAIDGSGNPTQTVSFDNTGTVTATAFVGDGSGLTGITGAGGDNLGDHTATQALNLNGNYLSGDGGNEGVFVDNNGNVGIGTTTPAEALEVAGDIQFTRDNPKLVFFDDTGSNGTRQSAILNVLVSALGADGPDRQSMVFNVSNGSTGGMTSVMTLLGNGKVGIGTTSPETRLDVNGTLSATSITFPDGTVQSTARGTGIYIVGNGDFVETVSGDIIKIVTESVNGLGGTYISNASTLPLIAPVHLPHGSTVKKVTFHGYDAIATTNIAITLARRQIHGSGSSAMANHTSNTGSGAYAGTDQSITNATIDNSQYMYLVKVELVGGGWHSAGLLAVNAVVIEYE